MGGYELLRSGAVRAGTDERDAVTAIPPGRRPNRPPPPRPRRSRPVGLGSTAGQSWRRGGRHLCGLIAARVQRNCHAHRNAPPARSASTRGTLSWSISWRMAAWAASDVVAKRVSTAAASASATSLATWVARADREASAAWRGSQVGDHHRWPRLVERGCRTGRHVGVWHDVVVGDDLAVPGDGHLVTSISWSLTIANG